MCRRLLPPVVALIAAGPSLLAQTNWTVDRTLAGVPSGAAYYSSVSADGRFVAFSSYATNLVPNDNNGRSDVFVFDRQTQSIERVSLPNVGGESNGDSYSPSISADGRFVAFSSTATNLATVSTNGLMQVYRRDRRDHVTASMSLVVSFPNSRFGNGHSALPAISADGTTVAFESDATNFDATDMNGERDVYVRREGSLAPVRVSISTAGTEGNGASFGASVSYNGQFVAFTTRASNLVANDSNGATDVLRRDRSAGTTVIISAPDQSTIPGNGNSHSCDISDDGRAIAFVSSATNLVQGDTNGRADVFRRLVDPVWETTRVSLTHDRQQAVGGTRGSDAPAISGDGRFICFASDAVNLGGSGGRIHVADVAPAGYGGLVRTWRVSAFSGSGFQNAISADGTHVCFDDLTASAQRFMCLRAWRTLADSAAYGLPCQGTAPGTTVMPAALRVRFGSGYNSYEPLTTGRGRYQQVLLGSELPAALAITGIGLRQSRQHGGDRGGQVDLEIRVGLTTHDPSSLTPDFAANFNGGAPVLVLPRTTISVPDMPGTASKDPAATIVEIPFAMPFDWRALGFNLLIEIIKRTPTGFLYRVDAADGINTTIVLGSSDTAATGTVHRGSGPAICLRSSVGAPPSLYTNDAPVLGLGAVLRLSQARSVSSATLFVGASERSFGSLPLPFPLAVVGAPGCQLLAAPDLTYQFATDGNGSGSQWLYAPSDPRLLGAVTFVQAAVLDVSANSLGLAFSSGLRLRFGNY